MDCRHLYTVRVAECDAVRKWSEWEGKSPTMREELYQRVNQSKARPLRPLALIAPKVELLVALTDLWCQIRRR